MPMSPLDANAQMQPPQVTITDVQLNEGAGMITVTYDLGHAQPCSVTFRVSLDAGTTFLEPSSPPTGDLGMVPPGTGKMIIWNYTGVANIISAELQVIADDGQTPSIQAMVDQVDQSMLASRLQQMAIPRHHANAPGGLQAVQDTLLNVFNDLGLHTGTHPVTFNGTTWNNILGRHTGLSDPTTTYIVDGHYDAVANTPGADDNATAVVAMLEIARILSGHTFRKSLRFIGFSFEEQGLLGSQQYVTNGIPSWENIAGVLNMEMIGYYSDAPNSQSMPPGFDLLFPEAAAYLAANDHRGDFLTVVGNTASDPLNEAFMAACGTHVPDLKKVPLSVPGNGTMAPDLRRSDHAPFWDAGYQALMLTDGSNYRNPNYHLPSDDVGTIDLAFLTQCTKAVLAAAATLAEPMNAGMDSYPMSRLVGLHEHVHAFPCTAEVRPNPANDAVHIRLGDCHGEVITAELFDLKGTKVHGMDMRTTHAPIDHVMQVGHLARGSYILVLRTGEASLSLKVELG